MLGVPAGRGQTHAIASAHMAAHGRWQAPNHKRQEIWGWEPRPGLHEPGPHSGATRGSVRWLREGPAPLRAGYWSGQKSRPVQGCVRVGEATGTDQGIRDQPVRRVTPQNAAAAIPVPGCSKS